MTMNNQIKAMGDSTATIAAVQDEAISPVTPASLSMGEPLTEPQGGEAKRNECDCLRRPDSEGMPSGLKPDSPANQQDINESAFNYAYDEWKRPKSLIPSQTGALQAFLRRYLYATRNESPDTITVLKQAAEALECDGKCSLCGQWCKGGIDCDCDLYKRPCYEPLTIGDYRKRLIPAITDELKRLGEV